MKLAPLLDRSQMVVTLGPGGVGKTTTAAALAVQAARQGRPSLVCTIDPARRLARSMGLEGLEDEPVAVDLSRLGPPSDGTAAAPLHAMMLDAEATLDRMLLESGADPESARRLRDHPLYRVMARELPGMHEYAAVSRLYELQQQAQWSLIVLDTPPTSHALDFLDAPRRLVRALESPAIQWLVRPYLRAGHLSLKALGGARAYVLRRVAKIVGVGLLERIAEFLVLFDAVLDGVRARTEAVSALLSSDEVAYAVVSTLTPSSVQEAVRLAEQLQRRRLTVDALILNRVHQSRVTEPLDTERLAEALAELPAVSALPAEAQLRLLETLTTAHQRYGQLARADERQLARMQERLRSEPQVVTIPLLGNDVYDLEGLGAIGGYL
jgi:anion-transporting  ArsA/GET3 family ATPase